MLLLDTADVCIFFFDVLCSNSLFLSNASFSMVYFLLSQFGSPRRPLYLIITGVPNWIIKTLPTKQRHLSLLLLLPSHTIGPSLIQIIRKHNHLFVHICSWKNLWIQFQKYTVQELLWTQQKYNKLTLTNWHKVWLGNGYDTKV